MSHKAAKRTRRHTHNQQLQARIDPVLRQFILNLRAIFRRTAKDVFTQFPNHAHPCSTCALNPATDNWQGWDRTALNLQQAIEKTAHFYCHHGWPIVDGEYKINLAKAELCAGHVTIIGEPETQSAFHNAILSHHQPT